MADVTGKATLTMGGKVIGELTGDWSFKPREEPVMIPAGALQIGESYRISGTIKTSPWDNGEFDPIADLGAACERIQAEPKPNVILMHQETWDRMIEMIRTWIERYEAILRKPLLSGRYGKRRRQRAEGVAKYRYERRQPGRREHAKRRRGSEGVSPYRLTENIYAQDENGVLRLIERVSVNADAFLTDGEMLYLAQPDGSFAAAWFLLEGDHPKFTLTPQEDPMHENCGPCEAGLPEEMHSAPETKLKTVAKAILITLAAAVAAAFMRMC